MAAVKDKQENSLLKSQEFVTLEKEFEPQKENIYIFKTMQTGDKLMNIQYCSIN